MNVDSKFTMLISGLGPISDNEFDFGQSKMTLLYIYETYSRSSSDFC